MRLKEMLYQRLDILEENHVISKKVSNYSKEVVKMILQEKQDVEEGKVTMFITHLAMAGQRAMDGTQVQPMDTKVLDDVKCEPDYGNAVTFRDKILKETDIEFTETEKDFLAVHLCSLFFQERSNL